MAAHVSKTPVVFFESPEDTVPQSGHLCGDTAGDLLQMNLDEVAGAGTSARRRRDLVLCRHGPLSRTLRGERREQS